MAIGFSPDNRQLVTMSESEVRLWSLRLDELIDRACRTVGRNMTSDEWQQFMGDQKYRATCSNLPVEEEG
jgi:hypothetical protein